MLAVVAPQPDGAEELALVERPVPQPGPGEVLIKVAAAGVNRPDILQRRGLYPPPPGAPDILGLEIAGEVVDAGEGAEAADRRRWSARWSRAAAMPNIASRPAGTCLLVPDGAVAGRGGGDARDAVHRLGQSVRARLRGRRRLGAGPWRHQRHRHDGDRARQIVRPAT